jgi:hypothetical protein
MPLSRHQADCGVLGGGEAVLGFQRSQHFHSTQIGPDLPNLTGRGEKLLAYSMVSLSLW